MERVAVAVVEDIKKNPPVKQIMSTRSTAARQHKHQKNQISLNAHPNDAKK